ncbi:hypothetical protein E2C01_096998 [Portunus trituberculatus]|uniref:Uncharacterized protein n=1 Tax=Portunus trituberculatus TaxID=210409 RepID=A0A5B7K8C5_PORTR|nr:hypothetical protein [Portunus trituberculatus]
MLGTRSRGTILLRNRGGKRFIASYRVDFSLVCLVIESFVAFWGTFCEAAMDAALLKSVIYVVVLPAGFEDCPAFLPGSRSCVSSLPVHSAEVLVVVVVLGGVGRGGGAVVGAGGEVVGREEGSVICVNREVFIVFLPVLVCVFCVRCAPVS